ncbi:MAG: DUF748 domain-containing protein, partial [Desulfobulbaceae bacterium]|nr:DUF748 domain-containing protein [Desulfobulbaceae bacterium]
FSDLIGEKEKKESLEKEAKPFLFSINNITVVNGNIEFQDLYKETTHRVAELNLAVPSVSNLPYDIEKNVQPAFSAIINDAPFALDGKTKPFTSSRETGIAIKFDKINIPEYLAYIPNPTGLTLASGTLDVDVRVSYLHQKKDNQKLAVTGLVAVNDINLIDRQGVSYVRLPRLTVSLADSNLLEKEVRISGIRIDNPECEFERLSTGDILPLSLLTTGSDTGEEGAQDEKEESKEAPVALTIDEIHINSGRVKFKDSATPPFTIDLRPIDVKVVNFSTLPEKEAQFDISITTEADESLAVKGAFGINPLSASLGLDVKNIELKKLQPYVAEQVNIVLTDGAVSVQGDVTLQKRDDEEISLQFAGKSALSDLATVDTVLGEDLLRWKNLNLSGISFSSAPQALAIKDISFQDIYAKLIVAENGTLNLATLKRGGPEEETPQEGKDAEKKTASRIEIGRVAISGGTIDFLDRKIKPEFAASLTDLEGTVSALSSKEETLADVSISGTLNRQAPLKIIGKVNPLKEELYTDLTIEFYDIGLSPMSPYTGKYIGYKTEKGKLTLDLSYNIDNRDLKAKNNIFLDQFTLGAAVDSPDAANLPIHLALALLKNRKGEITLNVPVSGNLDDPEFSIAGIVFKVIFNLIAKAVTSPFALLGALIPEGEELQYVGFEPGLGGLDDDSQKKLEKMAEVLFERPGLRMDIIGRVDPEKDREAIET